MISGADHMVLELVLSPNFVYNHYLSLVGGDGGDVCRSPIIDYAVRIIEVCLLPRLNVALPIVC